MRGTVRDFPRWTKEPSFELLKRAGRDPGVQEGQNVRNEVRIHSERQNWVPLSTYCNGAKGHSPFTPLKNSAHV